MTYEFTDNFTDPFQIIEILDKVPGVDRNDAITFTNFVGINVDFAGTPFKTIATWRTKFNATVLID